MNGKWRFAENQWDYFAEFDENSWDHFGWSTAVNDYGMSTSWHDADYSGDFVDWGTAIDNQGTWFTLSDEEWDYLFYTRKVDGETGSNHTHTVATINGVDGLVIFPDDYTGEVSDFQEIPEGCVFLPEAWVRNETTLSINGGCYWSSTPSDESNYVNCYSFTGGSPFVEEISRYYGCSVRLVCAAE